MPALFRLYNRTTSCFVEIHAFCASFVKCMALTSESLIFHVGLTYQKTSFYSISGIVGINWRYYFPFFK